MKKADSEVASLSNLVEESSAKFLSCMKFFKFTPKKGKLEDVKPVEFFEPWFIFAMDYKTLWKKEQVKIQTEMLKEERILMQRRKSSLRTDVEVILECCYFSSVNLFLSGKKGSGRTEE